MIMTVLLKDLLKLWCLSGRFDVSWWRFSNRIHPMRVFWNPYDQFFWRTFIIFGKCQKDQEGYECPSNRDLEDFQWLEEDFSTLIYPITDIENPYDQCSTSEGLLNFLLVNVKRIRNVRNVLKIGIWKI